MNSAAASRSGGPLDPEAVRKRNNVNFSGRGQQVILFAHGFGCDQAMWRYVAPAFEDEYKVVLFDYVGCGKSDWSAYDERRYSTLEGARPNGAYGRVDSFGDGNVLASWVHVHWASNPAAVDAFVARCAR